MTGVLFRDWLLNFDDWVFRKGKRRVLLLVDNARVHHSTGLELQCTTVEKLPPNTTSVLQPLDQGIIMAAKRRYRKWHTAQALDNIE